MADDDIRIRAELEGALTRDLTAAADAVDELGDQAEQTAAQLAIMDVASRGAARGVSDLGGESRSTSRSVDELAASHRRATKASDNHTSALSRFDGILKRIKGKKFDFGAVLGAYKIPAIVTAVNLLATTISALGAAGYAGVAGLAPLGSLLMAYPGFLAAGVQGFAAVKLGLSGVGGAVKALMNPAATPAQITKAMKDLSPAAQDLARQLVKLNKGPLKELKARTAAAVAPGFEAALRNLAPLFPVLTRNIARTGGAIGDLAAHASHAMAQPFFRGQLNRIMGNNTQVITHGGKAVGYLGLTLLNLLDAFRPVLLAMSVYAERGAKFLSVTSRAGLESGRLGAFFQRAWRLGKAFGAVVRDLTIGLFNIGRQSRTMGQYLGGSLQQGAAAFRAWTESIGGQASIQKWFADAVPVVREVLRLIGALAVAFGGLSTNSSLAPILAQIRTQLLPAIVDLAGGVTTAFGPAFVTAATAIAKFYSALSFSPLAVVLEATASALIHLADAVVAAPEPLRTMLASVLALSLGMKVVAGGAGLVAEGLSPMVGLARGFSTGVSGITKESSGFYKVAAKARTGLSEFAVGFSNADMAASSFTGRMGSMGGLVKSALTKVGTSIGLLTVTEEGAAIAGEGMWAALLGPIGWVIIAIVAVIALGVLLYKKWKPFRDLVNWVWKEMKVGAAAAWGYIKTAFSATVHFLEDAWHKIAAAGVAAWKPIHTALKVFWAAVKLYIRILMTEWKIAWKIVSWAAKVAFALIGTTVASLWVFIIQPILKNMAAGFEWAWGIIKFGARIVAGVVAWAFRHIAAAAAWVWHRVASGASWVWGQIKAGIRLLVGFAQRVWARLDRVFGGPFHWLKLRAGDGLSWVRDRVRWLADRITAIFTPVGTFLGSIWDGMKSAASGAIDWISNRFGDVARLVNKGINAFNALPGPDIPTIPGYWAGGQVPAGQRAMVGEIGPEAFVKASGAIEIIGKHGPEVRQFASGGYVVPNHVLAAASKQTDASLPSALLSALDRNTATPAAPAPRGDRITYEDHSVIRIELPAGASAADKAMVAAVVKAVEAKQREREERLINHGWKDPGS